MIEAKGRNGYFQVDQVQVWHANAMGNDPAKVYIDFSSKRQGEHPPMRIVGEPGVMCLLLEMIGKVMPGVIKEGATANVKISSLAKQRG